MRKILSHLSATCVVAALAALPAAANDGWGGLSAAGLTFSRTDAVEMVSEDLYVGLDKVKVDYVFRNKTGADVSGEVIFPMPPIGLAGLNESAFAIPLEELAKDDFINFTATVDGKPVQVSRDRIAVIEPDWQEGRPASFQYDTPGTDITASLQAYGIPINYDIAALQKFLLALPKATKDELTAKGLAEFSLEGDDPSQHYAYPRWSIVDRYHWPQTFPAGKEVRVSHAYRNAPPGGLFYWNETDTDPESYQQEVTKRYCIDKGTQAAIKKTLKREEYDGNVSYGGTSTHVTYVLRTANSWAGPIKSFKLTVDKGNKDNVLSICADGIKKVSPTSFSLTLTNYSPDRDLEFVVFQGYPE